MSYYTDAFILVILIALSAFFSGAELALFSLSKLRVKHLLRKKVKGALDVDKLKKDPQKLLITILIGNNLVNVGASALTTSIVLEISKNYAVSIATGIMTILILVFGEITPKSFATKHGEAISLKIAKPLLILQIIIYPIVSFFEGITFLLTKKPIEKPLVTEEELKSFVSIGEEIGQIEALEKKMVHRVFGFSDTSAKEIMTPRKKIVGVPANKSIREVAELLSAKKHSKIPVYRGNLNNIVGFIHFLDLHKSMLKDNIDFKKASSIMKSIPSIHSGKKLDSLLRLFQRYGKHIAVVTNDHGRTLGLITLEDVLEEIVGEIIEEHEKVKKY